MLQQFHSPSHHIHTVQNVSLLWRSVYILARGGDSGTAFLVTGFFVRVTFLGFLEGQLLYAEAPDDSCCEQSKNNFGSSNLSVCTPLSCGYHCLGQPVSGRLAQDFSIFFSPVRLMATSGSSVHYFTPGLKNQNLFFPDHHQIDVCLRASV